MKYSMKIKQTTMTAVILILAMGMAYAAEPKMDDYTAIPVASSSSPAPNIMVILDNSGSMQNMAYEDYPYQGEPYNNLTGTPVSARADDAEERMVTNDDPDLWSGDLDLGEKHVAILFRDINIPQGAVINSARIEFVASNSRTNTLDVRIYGMAKDSAGPWPDNTDDYIKDLLAPPQSDLTVSSMPWIETNNWVSQSHYDTPDLTAVVQEIITRGGWVSGNDMAFVIEGIGGKRDVYSRDGSFSRRPVLHIDADNSGKQYYGYFNPDYFYRFDSALNYFVPMFKKKGYDNVAGQWNAENLAGGAAVLTDGDIAPSASPSPDNGLWDGNWLNWCTMRRMDVLRKVLVGGTVKDLDGNIGEYATDLYARDDSGKQRNVGEWQNTWWEDMWFDSSGTGPAVSPYDGNFQYVIDDGDIRVDGDTIPIDVLKDESIDAESFFKRNLAGVIQRVGNKARWGNIWFNRNNSTTTNGGKLENIVGSDLHDLVHNLESKPGIGNTPLAETFYVALQYFRQQALTAPGYPSDSLDASGLGVGTVKDPYWNQQAYDVTGDGFIECAPSFVILLTDGQPTRDGQIPSMFKNTDPDGHGDDFCTDCGSNALDDIALWAHVNDIRLDADLPGDQTIDLYTVYAFDDNETARTLLKDAARNGAFEDGNTGLLDLPDGSYTDPPEDRLEWDKDGDGIPDTYFEASDGYALESQMINAIMGIFAQASSGTAASVLSTNTEGEGNAVQAYYKPVQFDENIIEEARWVGFLQNMWLDQWGNLREDTKESEHGAPDKHKILHEQNTSPTNDGSNVDQIIQFHNLGPAQGNKVVIRRFTKHYLYNPDNGNQAECIVADCSTDFETVEIGAVKRLFEANEVLSTRDPDTRTIWTGIDTDKDGVVEDSEKIDFDLGYQAQIKPFLGVADNAAWGTPGAKLGAGHDERVQNIITWVRGTDVDGLRNRTLDGVTSRLGDIVHSSPMTIGKPEERFDLIYLDETYREFFLNNKNRETVVYVGGNDGMLHAFSSWRYERQDLDFPKGSGKYREASTYNSVVDGDPMGHELWAYIPQAVLPHLKWTAHNNYTHTYYVDAKPRVFDARIGANDTWRTILVVGLNMGGKAINVTDDFGGGAGETRTFKPSYICMDITDPRNPSLLWERSYDNLGFTWAEPSPVRVGELEGDPGKWFLVFGSGPSEYDGTSNQGSYLFVVDMKTGDPVGASSGKDWHSGPYENYAFFGSPLAVDATEPPNYNVDAIYLPNIYDDGGFKSKIYRLGVSCSPCPWDTGFDIDNDVPTYDADPGNWVVNPIFEVDAPIMKKMTAAHGSKENQDHLWLFAGTGRFVTEDDKLTADPNYMLAIQDPYFNKDHADFRNINGPVVPLTLNQLFHSNDFTVDLGGNVFQNGISFAPEPEFDQFIEYVRDNFEGWYHSLDTASGPAERVISRNTAFGRFLWFPTYTPSQNVCEVGYTQLYGLYYETGTNGPNDLFATTINNGDETQKPTKKYPTKIIGAPPPRVGIHMGREGGAKVIMQQGSGEIPDLPVQKFFQVGNGVADWWAQEEEYDANATPPSP